jgi:DNA (cytosine-5)-methyltransferase 1
MNKNYFKAKRKRVLKHGKSKSRNSTPKAIRCVDLFAGAGGLSLAAKAVDIEVVVAVENNPRACDTYRLNLINGKEKATKLYEKNILELSPEEVSKSHFSEESPCDLVLGGPPCQGFSTHRINGAGIGDPRNDLILRYFAFVDSLRPKLFLMENVPGILWPRHKKFLKDFYARGVDAGYDVKPPVMIDARDYGVPQRRKRVFILGVRNDVAFNRDWPPTPSHGSTEAVKVNPKLKPWVPASVVFDKPIRPTDLNIVHMNHSSALIEAFKSTPPNGGSRNQSRRTLPCHSGHDGHWDVYGRIDPEHPGPTMTTACINPSKGRFVHPTEHHGITVRHAARFQTFPDSFVFCGGLMSSGEQIGNAVPVLLGKLLLKHIRKALVDMPHDGLEQLSERKNG